MQWIHKDLQFMKMAMEENKFFKWCKLITEYQKEKNIDNHIYSEF